MAEALSDEMVRFLYSLLRIFDRRAMFALPTPGVGGGGVDMSMYATIVRWRYSDDAKIARQQVQDLISYFLKWSPPQGTKLMGLYPSLDFKMVIGIWEADSHNAMSVVAAQYVAWMDVDIIPITTAEEGIAALAAGGLIEAP